VSLRRAAALVDGLGGAAGNGSAAAPTCSIAVSPDTLLQALNNDRIAAFLLVLLSFTILAAIRWVRSGGGSSLQCCGGCGGSRGSGVEGADGRLQHHAPYLARLSLLATHEKYDGVFWFALVSSFLLLGVLMLGPGSPVPDWYSRANHADCDDPAPAHDCVLYFLRWFLFSTVADGCTLYFLLPRTWSNPFKLLWVVVFALALAVFTVVPYALGGRAYALVDSWTMMLPVALHSGALAVAVVVSIGRRFKPGWMPFLTSTFAVVPNAFINVLWAVLNIIVLANQSVPDRVFTATIYIRSLLLVPCLLISLQAYNAVLALQDQALEEHQRVASTAVRIDPAVEAALQLRVRADIAAPMTPDDRRVLQQRIVSNRGAQLRRWQILPVRWPRIRHRVARALPRQQQEWVDTESATMAEFTGAVTLGPQLHGAVELVRSSAHPQLLVRKLIVGNREGATLEVYLSWLAMTRAPPCILPFHGYRDNGDSVALFFDFCERGSLTAVMRAYQSNPAAVPLSTVCDLSLSLLQAVSWCHAAGIVHNDLKPDNFLVTRS
jgi:hypothetical protein